jgi:RNA polymerase sigma factor (sigma-70 family)
VFNPRLIHCLEKIREILKWKTPLGATMVKKSPTAKGRRSMTRVATVAARGIETPWDREPADVRTDSELLHQFLSPADDAAEAAFVALVDRYGPIVHRVCLDVLGSSHEAEDAAQAVFLVLASKARSIRKPESLGPWLHGVALRVARRARREAARRRVAERNKAKIMRQHHAAESELELMMDYAELHDEIDRLPDQYRRPIILCYMQGQTQAQAARTLDWPLGTVQIRLHRGRERLRSRLTRRDAGLIAVTNSELATSVSVPAGVLGRDWTGTTARAAIRFAAGKATAGLVAPTVTRLAESVLAAMLADSLKVVSLLAIAFFLAAAALYWKISWTDEAHKSRSQHLGPKLATTPGTKGMPAPRARAKAKAGIRNGVGLLVDKPDQRAGSAARAKQKPRAITRAETSVEATPTPLLLPQDDPVDEVALLRSPTAPVGSPSLGAIRRPSERALAVGRELFERVWVKNDLRGHWGDGLGPVFNGQSCVDCHNLGGSGGAGGVDRNIEIVTVIDNASEYAGYSYSFSMDFGAGKFEYRFGGDLPASLRPEPRADPRRLAAIHPGFSEARSVVLHRYGTDPAYNAWRDLVPGRHGPVLIQSSERNPPPLFGTGLIDAISDDAIEAAAKRKSAGSSGQPKGRVSRLKDGRIGRFGWKAQAATLEEFVLSAAAGEIGLEVPGRHQAADPRLPGVAAKGLDMDQGECDDLVDYVRSLPVAVGNAPAIDKDSAQIKAGESTFKSIGCAGCHIPKLGHVDGIYSDLLLHDMGPQLGDSDTYTVFVGEPSKAGGPAAMDRPGARTGPATVREWRTPPLWGLRDSGPYLHDGRAATITQAIALHAGQAAISARRFAELSARRKQQIETFLMSLAAPAVDR